MENSFATKRNHTLIITHSGIPSSELRFPYAPSNRQGVEALVRAVEQCCGVLFIGMRIPH